MAGGKTPRIKGLCKLVFNQSFCQEALHLDSNGCLEDALRQEQCRERECNCKLDKMRDDGMKMKFAAI